MGLFGGHSDRASSGGLARARAGQAGVEARSEPASGQASAGMERGEGEWVGLGWCWLLSLEFLTKCSPRGCLWCVGSRPGTPHHFQHKTPVLPQLLTRLKSVKDRAHDKLHRNNSTGSRQSSHHPLSRSSSISRSPTSKLNPLATHRVRSQASLVLPSPAHPATLARQRPALKLRLVTMNMHDDLPLGDLTDFLGDVRACPGVSKRHSVGARSSIHSSSKAGSVRSLAETGSVVDVPGPDDLPRFPLEDGHPYHVVVVAAQECPLASGVTSGKLNTSRQAWTNTLETWLCGGTESDIREEEAEEAMLVGKDGDVVGEEEEMVDWEAEKRIVAERVAAGADNASLHSRTTATDEQDEQDQTTGKGYYVLVEKERLMGVGFLSVRPLDRPTHRGQS